MRFGKLWLAGCLAIVLSIPIASATEPPDSEEMLIRASQLTKLSTVVESAVRYKSPPADLDEAGLLAFSVQHDPLLLGTLASYKVRVLSKDRHALVLVCSQDASRGYLEDAGCTKELDKHVWRDDSEATCEFTLDIAALCAAREEAVMLAASLGKPVAAGHGIGMIEIDQAIWTQKVDESTRQPAGVLETSSPRSPLVIWMRIRGADIALDRLAADGKLPLKHKWSKESHDGIHAEGIAQTDSITLNAGSRDLLQSLRREVQARGYFDWRTWSSKASPGRGVWRVDVVYADNTPVMCGDVMRKPCRFSITVK